MIPPAAAAIAPVPGTSDEDLVTQIKDLQRSDPHAKEQWLAYVDLGGQGVKDPAKHTADFLGAFLAQLQSGIPVPRAAGEDTACLGEAIKLMQKKSPSFKGVWGQFCQLVGGGRMDPAKHDATFHIKFLDHLASTASGGALGPVLAEGPPQKRMRDVGGVGLGMAVGGGLKEQLVASVKAFQRMGTDQKELWNCYVDTYLQGVRDPSRHDASVLQEFCTNHNVPAANSAPSANGGGLMAGKGAMMGGGGEKQQLADRVKAFQRMGTEQKELWNCYSDTYLQGVRDPSRHDASVLQEFCTNHSVPAVGSTPSATGGALVAGKGMMGGKGAMMSAGGEKDELATRVKAFQRMGTEQKEMWNCYSDTYLQGVRDPSRHDAATLREFCDTHGVPAAGAAPAVPKVGMMGGMMGGMGMGAGTPAGLDPVKDELVQRIKVFQKAAKSNVEAWCAFCGATKDPNRHDAATLQEFCDTHIPI